MTRNFDPLLSGARLRDTMYNPGNSEDRMETAVLDWRKASRSQGNGGECVEIGAVSLRRQAHDGQQSDFVQIADEPKRIAVRDSKHPDGPKLCFGANAWWNFTRRVRSGVVDLR